MKLFHTRPRPGRQPDAATADAVDDFRVGKGGEIGGEVLTFDPGPMISAWFKDHQPPTSAFHRCQTPVSAAP